MALITPTPNTHINQNDYANPDNDLLRKLILGGSAAGLEGGNQRNALKTKANLDSQREAEKIQRAQDLQQASGPYTAVDVDGTSIKPQDPLARLIQLKTLQDHEKAQLDKGVQGLSDRVSKSNLPEMQSNLDALNNGSPNGLKSVGPIKNYVPDALVGLLQGVGVMPQGSVEERQHIAALRNAAMHAQFGSRQTEAEKSMLADQLGLHGGTSAESAQAALNRLGQVSGAEGKNIQAGSSPEAQAEFKKRGGNLDFGKMGNRYPVKQFRNKATGQVKTVYSDGSEEIK